MLRVNVIPAEYSSSILFAEGYARISTGEPVKVLMMLNSPVILSPDFNTRFDYNEPRNVCESVIK